MQASFSDPRIAEYMEDGGAKYNEELHQFLNGLARLSSVVHGSILPTQKSLLYSLQRGKTIHEAVIEEYEFLRSQITG